MGYICLECKTFYQRATSNFICDALDCPGEGVTGILIEEKVFGKNDSIIQPSPDINKRKDNKISQHEDDKMAIKITIGRSANNDISILDETVSFQHAIITIDHSGRSSIKDLGSLNGTFINGKAIHESVLLKTDLVTIASLPLDWLAYLEQSIVIEDVTKTISIGRSSINDIIIPKEDVSSLHATILIADNGKIFLKDENSKNGTYINGHKIRKKQLYPKDKILLAKKHCVNWRNYV